jgi:type I restriction enzyme M protein
MATIPAFAGTGSRSSPRSDILPPPEVIAQEIVEDIEAALEQFRLIAGDLNGASAERTD